MADLNAYFDPSDDPNVPPGGGGIPGGTPPPPTTPPAGGNPFGWIPLPPVPPPNGGGGGGGGGAVGAGDFGPQFDFSAFPRFNPVNARFTPLSAEQARQEPGYAFAEQQGQQGIERSAAARGALRTGGTLKDIGQWVSDFAARNYGDANQRELNRFLANYQVEKDQYAPLLSEAQARFNAEMNRGLAQYGRYTAWNAPRGGGGGGSNILSYDDWKNQNGYA